MLLGHLLHDQVKSPLIDATTDHAIPIIVALVGHVIPLLFGYVLQLYFRVCMDYKVKGEPLVAPLSA